MIAGAASSNAAAAAAPPAIAAKLVVFLSIQKRKRSTLHIIYLSTGIILSEISAADVLFGFSWFEFMIFLIRSCQFLYFIQFQAKPDIRQWTKCQEVKEYEICII